MKMVSGNFVCKRKAPFPLADDAWIDQNGNWGPKRSFGYFNNWCPPILQCLRSNHDVKLMTNGSDTNAIAWYITHYVAKKQKKSSNSSALLAKSFAFHHAKQKRDANLTAINKRLIQSCGNCLTHEQELSAPEAISLLMGWGDCYISHHFKTLYWYSLFSLLKKTFPDLNTHRCVLTKKV